MSDRVMLGRSSSRFNRCFPSYSYSVSTTGLQTGKSLPSYNQTYDRVQTPVDASLEVESEEEVTLCPLIVVQTSMVRQARSLLRFHTARLSQQVCSSGGYRSLVVSIQIPNYRIRQLLLLFYKPNPKNAVMSCE